MRRVVVTGLGVVSSIGNNAAEVTQSLKDGKSGIEFVPEYRDLGFRSQVAGTLKLNVEELVDRRLMRFMGNGAAYAYLAMKEAIERDAEPDVAARIEGGRERDDAAAIAITAYSHENLDVARKLSEDFAAQFLPGILADLERAAVDDAPEAKR